MSTSSAADGPRSHPSGATSVGGGVGMKVLFPPPWLGVGAAPLVTVRVSIEETTPSTDAVAVLVIEPASRSGWVML